MSVSRVLLAHTLVVLILLITAACPSPFALPTTAAGTGDPTPGCPQVSPVLDIRADHKQNLSPSVAYNPIHDEWLVVWHTVQGPFTTDIWAARLDADGRVIKTFSVATSAGVQRSYPAVAFSSVQREYLVVYVLQASSTDDDVYAKRVNWDGAWISLEKPLSAPVDLQLPSAVAYNDRDDEYLVVYTNFWSGGTSDVAALRVRARDGQIQSWANVHTGSDGKRLVPDVAYDPLHNQYLIVYDFQGTVRQIRGKVASASLAGVSTAPEIELCCNPQTAPLQGGASVAAGPDGYLVAFMSLAAASPIYARRIGLTGDPLGPDTGFALTQHTPASWDFPDVAFAGDHFLAAWTAESPVTAPNHGVFGCRVTPGQDDVVQEFTIEDRPHVQVSTQVACTPQGSCLVVFEDTAPDAQNRRIRAHLINPCPKTYLPVAIRNATSR